MTKCAGLLQQFYQNKLLSMGIKSVALGHVHFPDSLKKNRKLPGTTLCTSNFIVYGAILEVAA
jgi:hypothetical protein